MSDKRVEMKTALGIGGPIIQVTTARGGRKYELPSVPGSPSVPSVTSIIGGTLKSWQLENWKLKWIRDGLESYLDTELSYDTIDAILSASGNEARASAAIGSQMHDIIDGLLQGNQEIVVPAQLEPAVRGFLRWRQAHANWEYIDSEVAVFTQNFAGTVDALFREPVNKRYMVVDWKTSSGIYDSAMMQVAAYCYALDDMLMRSEETIKVIVTPNIGPLPTPQAVFDLKTGQPVEGMVVRFDNNYPLDGDGKKVRTLPKIFTDRVQIAKVDRAKWWQAFHACHSLHDGVKGSIRKEWI